ncbi:MAG: O-methyltransferase [Bacteroidales bacterium]|nr:O-methyltransferase [Bacteroidales bacterium]
MAYFEFPYDIERYAEDHTSDEETALFELYRKTYLNAAHPQMISGKVQGQFLSMISKMIRPQRILEIGTFTGYSAYCLAKGLQEKGELITIEANEELRDQINEFFQQSGLDQKASLLIGNALEIIQAFRDPFDLIFLDANKEGYPEYYTACIDLLSAGGILIADNVLWSGKVTDSKSSDLSTNKLQEFNRLVQHDSRVENVFLTIRDGLLMIRKK